MKKLLIVFILFSCNLIFAQGLEEMMREMMSDMMNEVHDHQKITGHFHNTGNLIETKSSLEKINNTNYEKIEILANADPRSQASLDVSVTDYIKVYAKVSSKSQGSQSQMSSTKIFPIPHKGKYHPSMTKNIKDKVVLYFEVPDNHQVTQSDIDSRFQDINSIRQRFFDSFDSFGEPVWPERGLEREQEPRRKVIIPNEKTI